MIKINNFTGMIPRLPQDRLPDGAAAFARNCDFRYGELRSLKGPGIKYTTTTPIRALFTDDGERFYAWSTHTRAYLGPVIDDVHDRMYFNTPGQGVRVTQRAGMRLANNNPGAPTTSYKVGVPRPTMVADPVTFIVTRIVVAIQRLTDGAVTREIVLTTLPAGVYDPWTGFDVFVPPDVFDDTSTAPEADGFFIGPGPITYFIENPDGSRGPAVQNCPARTWAVNAAGDIRRTTGGELIYTTDDNGDTTYTVNPSNTTTTKAQSVYYADSQKTYADGADMYVALIDGSALTSGATDFRFRVTIYQSEDGVNEFVHSDDIYPHEPGAANTYHLRAPITVGSGLKTIAYVCTATNAWGEESAPSEPIIVEARAEGGQFVNIAMSHTADADMLAVTHYNIYRTETGSQSSNFFFLEDVPIQEGPATYFVDKSFPQQSAIILSDALIGHEPPPVTVENLTYAGNGSFCVSNGKDLIFSEPYKPYAWPYMMTFPNEIVGVIEVQGGVLVTTNGLPYYVYGAHPEQMTQQALSSDQAGVGAKAMSKVEGSAVYASNDGLVSTTSGKASIQESQQLFTRNDWRDTFRAHFNDLYLSSWDGMLFGVVDGTPSKNFLMRLDEAPSFSYLSESAYAVSPAYDDGVYVLYNDGFASFGIGDNLAVEYHSKVYDFPQPMIFGACIAWSTGNFSVAVYADGVLIHTQAVSGETHFRLPSGFRAKKWQVRITGTGTFHRFEMGVSFVELANA